MVRSGSGIRGSRVQAQALPPASCAAGGPSSCPWCPPRGASPARVEEYRPLPQGLCGDWHGAQTSEAGGAAPGVKQFGVLTGLQHASTHRPPHQAPLAPQSLSRATPTPISGPAAPPAPSSPSKPA